MSVRVKLCDSVTSSSTMQAPNIRYMKLDASANYAVLQQRVRDLVGHDQFRMFWKDSNGEEPVCGCDDELEMAVVSRPADGLLTLWVRHLASSAPSSATPSPSRLPPVVSSTAPVFSGMMGTASAIAVAFPYPVVQSKNSITARRSHQPQLPITHTVRVTKKPRPAVKHRKKMVSAVPPSPSPSPPVETSSAVVYEAEPPLDVDSPLCVVSNIWANDPAAVLPAAPVDTLRGPPSSRRRRTTPGAGVAAGVSIIAAVSDGASPHRAAAPDAGDVTIPETAREDANGVSSNIPDALVSSVESAEETVPEVAAVGGAGADGSRGAVALATDQHEMEVLPSASSVDQLADVSLSLSISSSDSSDTSLNSSFTASETDSEICVSPIASANGAGSHRGMIHSVPLHDSLSRADLAVAGSQPTAAAPDVSRENLSLDVGRLDFRDGIQPLPRGNSLRTDEGSHVAATITGVSDSNVALNAPAPESGGKNHPGPLKPGGVAKGHHHHLPRQPAVYPMKTSDRPAAHRRRYRLSSSFQPVCSAATRCRPARRGRVNASAPRQPPPRGAPPNAPTPRTATRRRSSPCRGVAGYADRRRRPAGSPRRPRTSRRGCASRRWWRSTRWSSGDPANRPPSTGRCARPGRRRPRPSDVAGAVPPWRTDALSESHGYWT
ncbi:uncharacterized protein LOC129598831 isoform X2 [Paramacrobiotus metropolitanus]|uniref:uncharacterized protein LOC129598831 isoform X2 n=1 Tax=Paramacrobiotus metropolitanus TaxID=2943436 RepID=UPI0024464720|nr:uncharacterized protein LOC129598831 isoform X2 [Paramacrobiotus metropolitanus]